MATRAQKTQVGIFVIVGLILVVVVFAVISIKRRQPTATFFIKFHESVSGLTTDSNVLYQGVPVGKVEQIRVTKDNEIIVTVGLSTRQIILRKGTVATLGIANLMGGSTIELSGGNPNSSELSPNSFIESKPSIMENITQDLPKILQDIRNILSKIDRTMGDVKSDRLGSLVRNADNAAREVTTFLQTTEFEVARTMKSLRETITAAERTLTQLNENPSSVIWGKSKPRHPYVK